MIGAMVLARAVHAADPELATHILADVARKVAPAVEDAPEDDGPRRAEGAAARDHAVEEELPGDP